MATCRFCKEGGALECDMVRYGRRHLAHWECFFDRKGADAWDNLPSWQAGRTPVRLVRAHPELKEKLEKRFSHACQ